MQVVALHRVVFNGKPIPGKHEGMYWIIAEMASSPLDAFLGESGGMRCS